jgi:hypothetical protein
LSCLSRFYMPKAMFRNFPDFWQILVDFILFERFSRKGRGGYHFFGRKGRGVP